MPRPIIGITTDYNDKRTSHASPYFYAQAVVRAGGLPVLLPYHAGPELAGDYLPLLNGILLTGGDDPDPSAWGESYHPAVTPLDPAREAFERALIGYIESTRIPTLGICLGMQMLAVTRGGSLNQFLPDIPNLIEHRRLDLDWARRHPVEIEPGSILQAILETDRIETNTSHKQAVRNPGRDMRIVARTDDGVVEAIEDASFPLLLGVQWHPERLAADAPAHARLFQTLIEKARDHRR